MAVPNLYNECLQVWTQTIAFTMSRSNSIIWMQEFKGEGEDCLPEFSTNIRCCREISPQASFTHAGRSNLFSSVFTSATNFLASLDLYSSTCVSNSLINCCLFR